MKKNISRKSSARGQRPTTKRERNRKKDSAESKQAIAMTSSFETKSLNPKSTTENQVEFENETSAISNGAQSGGLQGIAGAKEAILLRSG